MARSGTVYLMYHELEVPRRELCKAQNGYVRYVVKECDFRAQLLCLKAGNWGGMSVSEGLADFRAGEPGVVLTFDDGCETDLILAAPLLKELGFNATFYVVAGYVGRRGYLSEAQLRELAGLNFEIGCHSMTHPHLADLDPERLRTEVVAAKERLEQMLGRRVDHFSCPGGRWNRRVARVAAEAGYRSVSTSRIGTNSSAADPFRLSRAPVMRATSLAAFERLCSGKGLVARQAEEEVLALAKRLLGNSIYDTVRSTLLGEN
jgi:peptidoglycan/xylan/chitin deacetylase (PgdA/CDA1 family)